MENASKALIIAGAILLSILIIGLGMAVFNNANSTQGKADLSSTEISAHNGNFEAYKGRIKGQQLRTLLNMINKNNTEYDDRPILVTDSEGHGFGTDSADSACNLNNVKSSTTYDVSFTYNGNDGLIDTCTVKVYGK